ncbi:MAG TPA: hypothetical protein VM737_03680 [Gemmatimonadota bacterium]|nr:hypothetical protein [Gemmatimonadota bacterium]
MGTRSAIYALRLAAFLALPMLLAATAAARGQTPAVDATGFTVPSVDGFELQGIHMMDGTPAIEGAETAVEVFANATNDVIYRVSLNGVTWAYGWLPGGEATQGYILRDPDCVGVFTEKWAPDAAFSAPECAVTADPLKEWRIEE